MATLKKARVGLGNTYMDVMSPSLRARKTITFTGAANLGAIGAVPLFTLTGQAIIDRIVARCTTDLAGATATLALGVTGSTSLLIGATTATGIDNGMFWLSTSPTANGLATALCVTGEARAAALLAACPGTRAMLTRPDGTRVTVTAAGITPAS